jgi:hypothetical protein
MNKAGLKVLRFSDIEVFKNLDGVIEVIWGNLPCPRKSPFCPPLQRGKSLFTKRGIRNPLYEG